MLHRLIQIIVLAILPFELLSASIEADSIKYMLDGRVLDPIEGVWQFPADGARLLIVKSTESTYDIYLLDSPKLGVRPGSKIGTAIAAPTPKRYDAQLDNKALGHAKIKKQKAMITIDEGHLRLKPYSEGLHLSLRRWLPYFFRISVTQNSSPDGLVGAARIYPIDNNNYKPCL